MAEPAFFHPNRGWVYKVRIENADPPVASSNDFATVSSEMRHFVDYEYLREVTGDSLVENLVTPTPPCTVLQATHRPGGDIVRGMLPRRLHVSVYFPLGCNKSDRSEERLLKGAGWALVKLSNVLVVEGLPVPLHMSLKTLELSPRMDSWVDERFRAEAFPPSFRTHPFWNPPPDVHYIGMSEDFDDRVQHLIESRSGRPSVSKVDRVCLACGKANPTKQCSRCSQASYCSQQCQRDHWKTHKKFCVPADTPGTQVPAA